MGRVGKACAVRAAMMGAPARRRRGAVAPDEFPSKKVGDLIPSRVAKYHPPSSLMLTFIPGGSGSARWQTENREIIREIFEFGGHFDPVWRWSRRE